MPVILNVTGPHQIKWAAAGAAPTFSNILGRTDNDDLFSVEVEYKYLDINTNEFGSMPAEAIQMGATAFANLTLVSFDNTQVQTLVEACAGATNNVSFPVVGQRSINDSNLVAIQVTSDISGPTYTINYARLISHTLKDVGNKPTRVGFRFEILPYSSGREIYTTT